MVGGLKCVVAALDISDHTMAMAIISGEFVGYVIKLPALKYACESQKKFFSQVPLEHPSYRSLNISSSVKVYISTDMH